MSDRKRKATVSHLPLQNAAQNDMSDFEDQLSNDSRSADDYMFEDQPDSNSKSNNRNSNNINNNMAHAYHSSSDSSSVSSLDSCELDILQGAWDAENASIAEDSETNDSASMSSLDSFELDILQDAWDAENASIAEGNQTNDKEDTPSNNNQQKKASITKYSIAHECLLRDNGSVFFSIDLEHGGVTAGILQLSVEASDKYGKRIGEFNEYVKPPGNANISAQSSVIHGLTMADARITSADTIDVVWPRFVSFIEERLDSGNKKGIMVAWGGKACDCEWLFKITEEWFHGSLVMPRWLDFFLDPSIVMKHYTSCRMNNKHTGLQGYGLELTWCHIMKKTELEGAHSSLVDCIAQTDILVHPEFLSFVDKPKSIVLMNDVFGAKRKRREQSGKEVRRKTGLGWDENDTARWEPNRQHTYAGPHGGPDEAGPSSQVTTAICNNEPIDPMVKLFLFVFPMSLLERISKATEQYARKDWVAPEIALDANGQPRVRKIFRRCSADHLLAQHRDSTDSWRTVTPGFVLAFFGILLVRGAYGLRCATLFWEGQPYGLSVPFIRNTMPRDVFLQMRRFIHFVDNDSLPATGDLNWHPLQKIQPFLLIFQERMQRAWVLGEKIAIDESMIKYCGRAISWVQYMPRKPIKHGIKVFALCCSKTGVLVAFLVYTGKATTSEDWSAVGVCDRLIGMSGLINKGIGRILYTDNWYTSIALMEHVYSIYGFFLVGTYVLTKKVSRTASDFPFHRLSNAACSLIPRGWSRRATRVFSGVKGKFTAQATVWKDKKQVGLLHNHCVEPMGDNTVLRYNSTLRKRVPVVSPAVIKDYSGSMGGVDRKDRDSADYTTSVRTNRFYLRIFFWAFDSMIHLMFNVVLVLARTASRPEWKKYKTKNGGRRKFQIDLALALIDYGINLDWTDIADESKKPVWVRQARLIPCDCRCCFFCKRELTNGVAHRTIYTPPPKQQRKSDVCSPRRITVRSQPQPCKECYKVAKEMYPQTKSHDLNRQCHRTRKGCATCQLVICEEHWVNFDHNTDRFKTK